jgi:hypothetical protein
MIKLAARASRILLFLIVLLFFLLTPFSTQLTIRDCHAAQVQLEWSPSDCYQVTGYKIHYGTGSGSYSNVADVGLITYHTLFGLDDSTTYYFAATAYDSNGNESGFSNEVVHLAQAPVVDDGANSGGSDPYDSSPDEYFDDGGSLDPGDSSYEDPTFDDGSGSLDPSDTYYEDPIIDDGSAFDPVEPPAEYPTMATVASIEYHTEGGRFSDAHLLITFTVLDNLGGPVSGASLTFELFRNGSSFLSGTLKTGADGQPCAK